MGEYILLGLGIASIVICIILLRKSMKLKTNKNWITLFIYEAVCIGCSIGLLQYFDNLPGYGFFPGFTYLGDVLICLAIAVSFFILVIISVIIFIVQLIRAQK